MQELMQKLETTSPLPEASFWLGAFKGNWGSAKRLVFTCDAILQIASPVIDGVGLGHDFPRQAIEPKSFDIVGRTTGDGSVGIDLWFDASFLRATPLVCDGALTENQRKIIGIWSVPCFTGCGCGGGGGAFSMRRVPLRA